MSLPRAVCPLVLCTVAMVAQDAVLPFDPGVYGRREGQWVDMEMETLRLRAAMFMPSSRTNDVLRSRYMGTLKGARSLVRVTGSIEFVLVCPADRGISDYSLLRGESDTKKDQREFPLELVEVKGMVHSLDGAKKTLVKVNAERIALNTYRIRLADLEKGEYALLAPVDIQRGKLIAPGKMYTFGVD